MIANLKSGFAGLLMIAACSSYAGNVQDPMTLLTMKLKLTTCQQKYKLANLQVELEAEKAQATYKEYVECKAAAEKLAKDLLKQSTSKMKTADGKKALKDYYVAYMSSLNSIEPRSGERVYQYEQRQADLQTGVEAAQQRLEAELP